MRSLPVQFAPRRAAHAYYWYCLSVTFILFGFDHARSVLQLQEQVSATVADVSEVLVKLNESKHLGNSEGSTEIAPPPYVRDAAEVAAIARFPLQGVLHSLESPQVQGVNLVALDVSATSAECKAEVEFSDFEALLKYMREINEGEVDPKWALVSAQASATGGRSAATIRSAWGTRAR